MIKTSAYLMAERYIGLEEIPGREDNPLIMHMLKMDAPWPDHDEVPWCSSFLNYICWQLRLPRSKSHLARSWLNVGVPIPLNAARPEEDVVILKRSGDGEPGPEDLIAPGHVGWFASYDRIHSGLYVLGGNQGDQVSVAGFDSARILGVRRLKW